MVDSLDHLLINLNLSGDHLLLWDLGGDVRHIWLQFEVGEVGHVVERHSFDVESELSFSGNIAERAIAQSLSFLDLELALVTLLFQKLLSFQPHSMRILVLVISSKFI